MHARLPARRTPCEAGIAKRGAEGRLRKAAATTPGGWHGAGGRCIFLGPPPRLHSGNPPVGALAEQLLDTLLGLPAAAVYLLVVVLCWAEAAFFLGFVTPGELAVATGGILASRGQVAVGILLAVVVVGTLAGNATGYALGRRWGTGILAWAPLRRVFGPSIERAETFMRQRGEWAIVLGRLATPTRIVVPFLAGASRLPYRRFVAFDVPATLVWATAWVGLGYVLGESWERLQEVAGRAALLVLLLFVTAVVIRWVTARVAANQRWMQAAFRVMLRATGLGGVARQVAPGLVWLGRRFDPRVAHGLSLTLAFLLLVGAVGAVGVVMSQTRAVQGLALVDFPVLEWMVATRTEEAVRFSRGVLQYLRWPGLLAVALPAAALTAWIAGWVPALRVGLGVVVGGGGAWALDLHVLEGVVPGAEYPSVPVTVAAVLLVHATAVAARRWGWTPGVITAGVGTFLLCSVALGTVVAGWAAPSGIALGLALGFGWATLLELPRTLLSERGMRGVDPSPLPDRASSREPDLNTPEPGTRSADTPDPGTRSADTLRPDTTDPVPSRPDTPPPPSPLPPAPPPPLLQTPMDDKASKTPAPNPSPGADDPPPPDEATQPDERELKRKEAEKAAEGEPEMEKLHDDAAPLKDEEGRKGPDGEGGDAKG